ncbi:hypothetical protein Q2490_15045 [Myroides odoratimimus]|uniref:hypothetical protein n=1 Tax=Myroides odoratimimus TaxID=76832 RepID=UPI0026E0C07E|nr:hypothetical protein [Myroides odoratimimus]MDO5858600.1 hypothetical protein [Myroides odoratimimus]
MKKIDGNEVLFKALNKLNINLTDLIAETSLWASPEDVKELIKINGSSTRFPYTRRKKSKEIKGEVINGIRLDDNTYANSAIKEILGFKGKTKKNIENMNTCHIYDESCYNEEYHTKIENLVLIPKAIAQLSDHYEEVKRVLKFRSYELYGWYLPSEGIPVKPDNYPTNWLKINRISSLSKEILINTDKEVNNLADKEYYLDRIDLEILKVERRVPKWFSNEKTKINSIILYSYLELLKDNEFVTKKDLEEKSSLHINKFNTNFNQMAHFGENNHGKVFEVVKDKVYLWEPVKNFILNHYRKYII